MRAFLALALLAAAHVALAAPVSAADALTVTTKYGTVVGFTANGTNAWRGVPYAAAPVGANRFRPPQPPKAWKGMRDGSKFGAACYQMGAPGLGRFSGHAAWDTLNVTNVHEDCLFANVYSPVGAKKLPVMLYIHAGEFRFGGSNDLESNWPYFVEKNKGEVVLVTANVRLGLLGFAALDSLRARDPAGSSGNYGMQDQRAVMQWVKATISSFGGDPERVTIFGESSGGTSVAFHLLSAKTQRLKLFQRAILESPGLTQSHTWEQSVGNTQYAVAALTSANSPGCAWPNASSKQEWLSFPGLVAHSYGAPSLGVAADIATAKATCAKLSACYLISVSGEDGSATLLGGGVVGNMTATMAFTGNETQRTGRLSTNQLIMRLADPAAGAGCLLAALPVDLIATNLGPPYTDTFYTDAAAPTIDGVELKEPIAQLARGPKALLPPGVNVLSGSNLDEGTEFMALCAYISCNATAAELGVWAQAQFGVELGLAVPAPYEQLQQPTPLCAFHRPPGLRSDAEQPPTTSASWVAAMRSAGDYAITCRARELLGASQRAGNDVYWYQFTATPIYSENMPDIATMGAFHGAEVPFVFGADFEIKGKGEQALSRAMGCYWVNFAASGNPNKGPSGCSARLKLPAWPKLGADGAAMQFSNTSIKPLVAYKKQKCDLFAGFA